MSNDWFVPSFPLIYLCSLSATVTQCLRGCGTMGNHVTSRLVGRASVHPSFPFHPIFFLSQILRNFYLPAEVARWSKFVHPGASCTCIHGDPM